MRSAYLSSNRPAVSLRRRASSFLLAIALELLIVLGLVTLSPYSPIRKKDEENTFRLFDPPKPKPPPPVPQGVAHLKKVSGGAAHAPKPARVKDVPVPPLPPNPLLNDKALFESADISKMSRASGDGDSSGKDSGSAYGPGEGPGGERLYNPEWYREPTDAELAGYIPPSAPRVGWALIACKTIADFHVDNCRTIGEDPLGSGLARDMRLAAWQFRVRPPRIGGRSVIGAWVRIRIDFSERGVQAR